MTEGAFDDVVDGQVTEDAIDSMYYGGKRRPQPTYSMLQDEELPF